MKVSRKGILQVTNQITISEAPEFYGDAATEEDAARMADAIGCKLEELGYTVRITGLAGARAWQAPTDQAEQDIDRVWAQVMEDYA